MMCVMNDEDEPQHRGWLRPYGTIPYGMLLVWYYYGTLGGGYVSESRGIVNHGVVAELPP